MCLTEKEKRAILTPLSLPASQRKHIRYRTKIKIQKLLQDIKFIQDNHNTIFKEFGIDTVLYNDSVELKETELKETELRETKLGETELKETELKETELKETSLQNQEFSDPDLL